MQLVVPLANGQTWGAYEPKYPAPPVVPTAQSTLEVAKLTGCDGIMCVPTFLEVRFLNRLTTLTVEQLTGRLTRYLRNRKKLLPT